MTSATSTSDPHQRAGEPATARRHLRGEALGGSKRYRDGTHRSCTPEETVERFRPAMERFGITRLADVTGLDRLPISTIIAVRPNATTLASGSGKGTSKGAATASALMEALEIAHAEESRLPSVTVSRRDLARRADVIDIDEPFLVSASLYSPDRPEVWVRGWDIVNGGDVFVPRASVDFTLNRGHFGPSSFHTDSNGLASGNTLTEAVLAGLYECIERDASTCWQLVVAGTSLAPRRVDVTTIPAAGVRHLVDALRAARLDLLLFDLTTDTAIPTFGALLRSQDGAPAASMKGFGTHLDPAVAMTRAITEAVQARAVYVAGTRDDVFDHHRRLIKVAAPPLDGTAAALIDAEERTDESTDDFGDDLEIVLERLKRVGIERVIAVDLREPDFSVPVVRVVVPGLEGYYRRGYRPGRRARLHVRLGSVASELASS